MNNDKQLCIGFTHFDPRFAFFWSIVGHCAQEEAERLGVKLISKPAPYVADQIIEIQKLLVQKIDALLITPVESGHPGLINVIETVNAAGIPVVALDSGVGGGQLLSTVRSDNIKGEEMVTEYIFERLGGKGKVIHLQGDLKVEVGAHRSEGFHNVLSRYPEIELVFEAEGNWYRDRGAELTQQALARHPGIQAVIAANDLTALGAGDAIAEVGRTKEILVAGFDALPEALLSIHKGQMTATVQQDADGMAREALQAAIQGVRGERVPSLLLTRVELITLDNLLKTTVNGLHMLPGVLRNLEEQKLEISKANALLEQHRDQLEELVADRTHEVTRQQYILDTFMDNIPDRIYFKDTQSRITRTNTAFATKIGVKDPKEMIGKSDFDFFPAKQAEFKYQQEQEIIKTGQPILGVEEPDGVDHWALTTKMPLRDEKGTIIGTFGISHDITELVKAKRTAEVAREDADKARQAAENEKERAETAKNQAEKAHKEIELAHQALAVQMWQTAGQAQLNDRMRGEQDVATLARSVIQQMCEYMSAQIGALYVLEGDMLRLAGTYAYRHDSLASEIHLGEGLVGEAALGKRPIVVDVPDDYLSITSSSLGELLPKHVIFVPFAYDDQVIGVVEIGKLSEFTTVQLEFLNKALESIAVGFTTAEARKRVNELLVKTQQQAGELQAQEEELRAANEELASQAENLRASEAKLRANQAELETVNVELEEKAAALQEQQQVLDRQNKELRLAQQELKQKADDLALASKYKSEFLANMSHELRTPLNSLLILAGMLAKNEQGNLTADQVESAQIICSGGTDLLNLINDILDLSKVEAGRIEFRYTALPLARLIESMRVQFTPLAEGKAFEFVIQQAAELPETIETDQQRVEQIVKNLLSNAFKFTQQGSVCLQFYRPATDTDLSKSGLKPEQSIAISVTDTGIGMTPEQQQIVFEAFQQADGSTSRQYGGTGLGLSISRELATELGGQIDLESELGRGSQFTLYLPLQPAAAPGQPIEVPPPIEPLRVSQTKPTSTALRPLTPDRALPPADTVPDDRASIRAGDRVLLIIEDDPAFAKIVQDHGRQKNFKCVIAGDGESGLKLAQRFKPDAIILDLNLPDISGWEVLDDLKHNPDTLHIPVHIITAQDESLDAFKRGAMGFLTKPIGQDQLEGALQTLEQVMTRAIKSLLVVEDDDNLRKSVRKLLEGSDVIISEANTGQAALAQLAQQHFDCMILDLTLPDMSGFELLNRLGGAEYLPNCPVIVYTGKALSEEENHELMKYADSVIVKGAKSPERLLDEAALFLHRVVADMPEEKQRMIKRLLGNEGVLAGKQILIVDDDARNAFALSKLLANKGLKVYIAPHGEKALDTLDKTPIDLVLMDIMLPGMDGYEIMRRIRAQLRFRQLPILALTAKAMKGDREKCLEAGANDYLSKPVDAERLLSMLRVWLSKE